LYVSRRMEQAWSRYEFTHLPQCPAHSLVFRRGFRGDTEALDGPCYMDDI
jgi:hypothetical protein